MMINLTLRLLFLLLAKYEYHTFIVTRKRLKLRKKNNKIIKKTHTIKSLLNFNSLQFRTSFSRVEFQRTRVSLCAYNIHRINCSECPSLSLSLSISPYLNVQNIDTPALYIDRYNIKYVQTWPLVTVWYRSLS